MAKQSRETLFAKSIKVARGTLGYWRERSAIIEEEFVAERKAKEIAEHENAALHERIERLEKECDEAVNISCPGGDNCGLVCNAETQRDEAVAALKAAMGPRVGPYTVTMPEGRVIKSVGFYSTPEVATILQNLAERE